MLLSVVEISKAKGLLIASSAPLIDRHLLTSMIPRGSVFCKKKNGRRALDKRYVGRETGELKSNNVLVSRLNTYRQKNEYSHPRYN